MAVVPNNAWLAETVAGSADPSRTAVACRGLDNRFHIIMLQRPDATQVAGFHRWKALGRAVRKGEKGIAIIVPHVRKVENKDGEEEQRVTSFGVGHVFDRSQTEGKPLPEITVPLLEGDEGTAIGHQLYELACREGLDALADAADLPPGVMGAYWPELGKIRVRPAPIRQMVKTLAHELAHHVHLARVGAESQNRQERETVAESVAFVVCGHFGLDTGERSFPYVATWARDKDVFRQQLGTIQAVSAFMIDRMEGEGSPDGAAPFLPATDSAGAHPVDR